MAYGPLNNEHEYRIAVTELERIFDAEPGTPEGERLTELSRVVAEYEATQGPEEEEDELVPWYPADPQQAAEALLRSLEAESKERDRYA